MVVNASTSVSSIVVVTNLGSKVVIAGVELTILSVVASVCSTSVLEVVASDAVSVSVSVVVVGVSLAVAAVVMVVGCGVAWTITNSSLIIADESFDETNSSASSEEDSFES